MFVFFPSSFAAGYDVRREAMGSVLPWNKRGSKKNVVADPNWTQTHSIMLCSAAPRWETPSWQHAAQKDA